jgi:hypothetical protein
MACALPLFEIVLDAPLEGTVLPYELLRDIEIA